MSDFDSAIIPAVTAGMLRASTPVVFAGLGEIIYERSGVFNLGIEGLMLVGAFAATAAQLAWDDWLVSLGAAAVSAGMVGFVHALFCVKLRTSQVVTGLAVFFLCQGLTAVLGVPLVGKTVVVDLQPPLSWCKAVPWLGPVFANQDVMVYGAVVAVLVVWFLLFKTRWGVVLRACGESAQSAAAAGVPVERIRLLAGTVAGMFAGLGGAHFSLFYAQQWQENMMSGRGWIALVMVIFGMWFPLRFLVGAYLFGAMSTLQLQLQTRGISNSQYLLAMLPFGVTLAMLVVASVRLKHRTGVAPADLGVPFER